MKGLPREWWRLEVSKPWNLKGQGRIQVTLERRWGGEDVNLPLLAWNFLLQSKNCAGFTIFNSWNRLFSSRHHKFQPPHCADEEIQAQGLAEVTPQVVK